MAYRKVFLAVFITLLLLLGWFKSTKTKDNNYLLFGKSTMYVPHLTGQKIIIPLGWKVINIVAEK